MLELYNEQAEKIVLGSLIAGKKIDLLLLELKAEYFYFAKHKVIFEVVQEMFRAGSLIDILTLSDKLSSLNKLEYIGGSTYLAQIINEHISLTGSLEHAVLIKEKYKLRSTIEFIEKEACDAKDGKCNSSELINNLSTKILTISCDNAREKTNIGDNIESFVEMQEQYATNKALGKETIGIPTGFRSLDKLIDGLREEHFITVSAGSSVGKSTLALNMAHNVLKQGKRVVIFSLEMSKNDMISKLMAIQCGLSPSQIMKGLADNKIYPQLAAPRAWLSMQKLTMYSDLDDFEEISMAMRVEEMKEHVDLFILDYLQNISSEKYRDEYSLLTNGVKLLQKTTRALNTTFLNLSQVSIDTRKGTATQTVEGKGTGAIRNASNVFIYMKRDLPNEEEVNQIIQEGRDMPLLCIVNKNRHGSIGAFKLNMNLDSGECYEPY
jgi:replicative DNA helicase